MLYPISNGLELHTFSSPHSWSWILQVVFPTCLTISQLHSKLKILLSLKNFRHQQPKQNSPFWFKMWFYFSSQFSIINFISKSNIEDQKISSYWFINMIFKNLKYKANELYKFQLFSEGWSNLLNFLARSTIY